MKHTFFILAFVLVFSVRMSFSQEIEWLVAPAQKGLPGATWKYVNEKPAVNWFFPGFDDSNWKTGRSGFGARAPGIEKMSTLWNSEIILLRTTFDSEEETPFSELVLNVYHDDDVDIYLNGIQVLSEKGYLTEYRFFELGEPAEKLVRGRNYLAIQCRQDKGGQYIDAGLALKSSLGQSDKIHRRKNVPVLYPTDSEIRWITDPTLAPIASPKMKWADTTKKFDSSGKAIPFSKDPTVVRFNGRYLMYFSLHPDTKEKKPYGWTIGIAESTNLVDWKTVAEIPPMQQCDAKGLCAPCARVWHGKVHLFYQTYGNGKNDAICYASSDDGIHFKPHPENPIYRPHGDWTCGRAIDADAFIFKDKLFLYAATRDADMRIQKLAVATADAEGLKNPEKLLGPKAWTQAFDGSILEPELPWETKCLEASTVCQRGNTLIMFYAGGYNNNPQQIGVAQSEDGIHWTRLWSVPFIPNGLKGSWNSSESGHPGVFVDDDGRTYLFYQGNPDNGRSWSLSQVEIGWENDIPFVLGTEKK